MTDWRKLEAELVDLFRQEGLILRDEEGHTIVIDSDDAVLFSLTDLAQQLALRLP